MIRRTRSEQPATPDPLAGKLDGLRQNLQKALEVEHSTIPPYFTAWLSIRQGPGSVNREAAEIVRSVMLEEMLHVTLVANVLNAVGGRPMLTAPDFVPDYPAPLPFGGDRFEISIEPFSKAALETFMKIELPEPRGARAEGIGFHTLGQFYARIREQVDELCGLAGEPAVFSGDPARQVQPAHYYGSGQIVVVTDRASAHAALDEIVEQGEGLDRTLYDADPDIFGGPGHELAHYFRFKSLLAGRSYASGDRTGANPTGAPIAVDLSHVFPIRRNTRLDDYAPGSGVREALERFASTYGELLGTLEESFNGVPSRLEVAIAGMFALKYQALALMRTPSGRGDGTTVGLTFDQRTTSSRRQVSVSAAAAPSSTAAPGAPAIDDVIAAHLDEFRRPGVLSVRSGVQISRGWLTGRRAIVVTVAHKRAGVPAPEAIPREVGGYPTDVREATPKELARYRDPVRYAEMQATARPEHEEAVFPNERHPNGPPAADAAAPRRALKPSVPYTPPPGASLAPVKGRMTLTCHAGPDAAWVVLKKFLAGVRQQLTVGMYDFTSAHVLAGVLAGLRSPRRLSLVLDHPSTNPTADQTDEATELALRKAVGARQQFAWAAAGLDPMVTKKIFATSYHIKVAVRDHASFWLSSGNWNNSNQAGVALAFGPAKPTAAQTTILRDSDRDWHIVVDHAGLARTFEAYLLHDREVAATMQAPTPLAPTNLPPHPEPAGKSPVPVQVFAPRVFANLTTMVHPLLTPDAGAGNYAAAILALIESARERLYVQTQYMYLPKPGDASAGPFLQIVNAVAAKIRAGLDVRLIFSEYEQGPHLEQLHEAGITADRVRIQTGTHNKGIVVDSKAVALGSQNWSTDGALFNRDASLIVPDARVAAYYEQIFLHDWEHMAVQQVPTFAPAAAAPASH